mgnify:CR=1 FL=1
MILLVFAYALGAFLLIFFTVWLRIDIGRRVLAIEEHRRRNFAHPSAAEAVALLRGDFEQAKNYRGFLENILPQPDQLINLPRELNGLAKQNNLDLAFSFGEAIKGTSQSPGATNFKMVVTGPLSGWINFLRGLEQGNYLVRIDSIDINYDGKANQLKIHGKVFSQ